MVYVFRLINSLIKFRRGKSEKKVKQKNEKGKKES